MSLNYTLSIAGSSTYQSLLSKLRSAKGYQVSASEASAPGLQVRLSTPGPVDVQIIEEEFGFTPGRQVDFRVDKAADPPATAVFLLRACEALLPRTSGDAVLLFNGETVIFLMRAGSLVLNPVEGFWSDAALAEVAGPYRLAPIRSI